MSNQGRNVATDNVFINWWLVSERKYTTFQKLYESNGLTYEQVKRLKIARACYEVVPSVIMTPVVFNLLKLSVRFSRQFSNFKIHRFGMFMITSYVAAIAARDAVYWPIVAHLYSELYRLDTKRAYQS